MVTPPWVVADGAGGAAAAAVAVEVVGASPGLVCGCVASLLLSAIFLTIIAGLREYEQLVAR